MSNFVIELEDSSFNVYWRGTDDLVSQHATRAEAEAAIVYYDERYEAEERYHRQGRIAPHEETYETRMDDLGESPDY